MKIRDLPCDQLEELSAACAEYDLRCDDIDDIIDFDRGEQLAALLAPNMEGAAIGHPATSA